MTLLKLSLIVIITIGIFLVLKSVKSEYAFILVLLLSVAILALSVSEFSSVFYNLYSLIPSKTAKLGFTYLLKVTGICIVTDFVANLCEDVENTALSGVVCLFGRLSMIVCILPLIQEVLAI